MTDSLTYRLTYRQTYGQSDLEELHCLNISEGGDLELTLRENKRVKVGLLLLPMSFSNLVV